MRSKHLSARAPPAAVPPCALSFKSTDDEMTAEPCAPSTPLLAALNFSPPPLAPHGAAHGKQGGSHSLSSNPKFLAGIKYKTEICKNYELRRECQFGASCCFAHGKEELRSKEAINDLFKTKVCKVFLTGACQYGSRCQYFHFKPFQKHQELRESFEKRLLQGVGKEGPLSEALDKVEKEGERLPVFEKVTRIGFN